MRLLPDRAFVGQVRPEGFPLELASPPDAPAFYWSYPEDSPDPNQFKMIFETDEPTPPDGLLTFLRGNIQRQGWTQWDKDIDNPKMPALSGWKMESDDDGSSFSSLHEAWFMPDRGLILVSISQLMADPNAPEELSDTFVAQQLLTPDTDQYRKYLKEYKAGHPEPSP